MRNAHRGRYANSAVETKSRAIRTLDPTRRLRDKLRDQCIHDTWCKSAPDTLRSAQKHRPGVQREPYANYDPVLYSGSRSAKISQGKMEWQASTRNAGPRAAGNRRTQALEKINQSYCASSLALFP